MDKETSTPQLVKPLRFLNPFIDQIDSFLMLNYGFTLWERCPELWEDYNDGVYDEIA